MLEYVVVVGDDLMFPFYRVEDDANIANESVYTTRSGVSSDNPTYAALDQGYIPTNDFYVDFSPLKWRSRELYVPELAIGRLVETPAEMNNMIQAFLRSEPFGPTTAFVGGYDFLIDSAQAISDTLGDAGLALTSLISDTDPGQPCGSDAAQHGNRRRAESVRHRQLVDGLPRGI
jgi:hypothetical protein